jgi:ABC-type nickel/cobalt efflux system permease component RcnA
MQIKNQIIASLMIVIMSIMMIHNAIPHIHHNHEATAINTHDDSHHSHDNGHHHSHSKDKKRDNKKSNENISFFDFDNHEHTVHLHYFEDYLLNKSKKNETNNQLILLSFISLNEYNYSSNYKLDEYSPPRFRFPESPPTYSFSLRGPPMLG